MNHLQYSSEYLSFLLNKLSENYNWKKYVVEILIFFNLFLLWYIVDGYENAKTLCDLYYMSSPELVLEEMNGICLGSMGPCFFSV